MSLASDIITRAYRETNIIPLGASPNTNQTTEALTHLNSLLLSTVRNEVGDPLSDLNIGGNYDQASLASIWVPENSNLVLNLSSAKTLFLTPYPRDGQLLSFIDVAGNLATYNLTIDGNGRKIESVTPLVLNTNGDSRLWLYRADTGNWTKITTLLSGDSMPFPQEFDTYFVTMLAMRINPRYGQSLAPETLEMLKRSRRQLTARYNPPKPILPDLDTRSFLTDNKTYSTTNNEFDLGRPWPWR